MRIANTTLLIVIAGLLAWYIVPRTEFGEHWRLRRAASKMCLPEPRTPSDYASILNYEDFTRELEKDGRSVPCKITQDLWHKVREIPDFNSLPPDARGDIERNMLENTVLMIQAPK